MESQTKAISDVMEEVNTKANAMDCSSVDIQQIEQMGQQMADSVHNYVMNVDITNAQFDMVSLYEEAQKLGLDIGDLKDYGFDPKNPLCDKNSCSPKDFITDIDSRLKASKKIREAVVKKGADMLNKAKCHPAIK